MSSFLEDRLLLLNITQTEVNKSSNYGSLQFQAQICIFFHGRNLYEFQRSKPFSKLHLPYLYPLSKQSFPNCNQNTRRSSLRISRSILVSQTAPQTGFNSGPQGTAANKCILVQTNICGCKQIYIDAKIIKHYVKLTNVAAN